MNEERKRVLNRKRNFIYNNDGTDALHQCESPNPEEFLGKRAYPLLGTHVDSVFYCPTSSGFSLFTQQTQVGQIFLCEEGMFSDNITRGLIEQGTDPFQLVVDFCRENDLEIFWSMRMNDTHDAGRPLMFEINEFKQGHPEYLMGTPDNRPKYGAWSAVDYGFSHVRDLAYGFVEEVCQNYNVDGVELDFFRHPVFFRATSKGLPVEEDETDKMTDMIGQIREMAEREGQKRGRPFLIAIRVPDSAEYCSDIGLDIERWMAEDLVDMYIPSCYFRLNPWSCSVELGHKYGVKVYPSLSESRVGGQQRHKGRTSDKCYRARAMSAWSDEADGIYLFNCSDMQREIWNELGDPEYLNKLDKVYYPSVRGMARAAGGNLPYEDYIHVPTLNPDDPVVLKPGAETFVDLHFGDDLSREAEKGHKPQVKLTLYFEEEPDPGILIVHCNGNIFEGGRKSGHTVNYQLPYQTLSIGYNTFEFEVREQITLCDLELHLTY